MIRAKKFYKIISLTSIICYIISSMVLSQNQFFPYPLTGVIALVLTLFSIMFKQNFLNIISLLLLVIMNAGGSFATWAFSHNINDWMIFMFVSFLTFTLLLSLEVLTLIKSRQCLN